MAKTENTMARAIAPKGPKPRKSQKGAKPYEPTAREAETLASFEQPTKGKSQPDQQPTKGKSGRLLVINGNDVP
jgi:hypothetical protein